MLVFGESVSKNGVTGILDWFERTRQFRFPNVFTATGTAKEILSAQLPMEEIPALGLKHLITYRYRHFTRITPTLNQFTENFFLPSKVSFATHLSFSNKTKKKKLEVLGLGFFHNGKRFATLNHEQVMDYIFIRPEKLKGGTLLIPCHSNPKKFTTYEFGNKISKIKTEIVNDKPVYTLSIDNEGSIISVNCGERINTKEQMENLEQEIDEIIKKRATNMIHLAQKKYKIDFLRFDEELKKQHLSYWREVENKWEEIFPTIEVKIEVNSHIRRISGATDDPIPEEN